MMLMSGLVSGFVTHGDTLSVLKKPLNFSLEGGNLIGFFKEDSFQIYSSTEKANFH